MKNIGNTRWVLGLGLSLALVVGFNAQSQALIVTVTPPHATSGPDVTYEDAQNLVNGSGLVGAGDDSTKTHDVDNGNNGWVTYGDEPVNTQTVTFDLGGSYNLTGTYIWAYNQTGYVGRGMKDFTIDISTDGTTFNPLGGTFTASIPTGANGEPAQFLPFTASGVQKIRFDAVSDWYGSTSGDDLVGLSEVRFQADVPEPASLGVLVAGGAMLLRRRCSDAPRQPLRG